MSDNRTSEPSGVTDANGHSWMSWDESGKNGTYCRSCGGWAGKVGNRQCSPAPELPSSGAPQEESVPKSSYISPNLPAQIRGLYRADLREKSIQTMLDLAGDLVQELIDLRAATVPPSSVVDEDKLAEVIEQARDRSRKDRDIAKESLGQYIARIVNERRAEWLSGQGGESRG